MIQKTMEDMNNEIKRIETSSKFNLKDHYNKFMLNEPFLMDVKYQDDRYSIIDPTKFREDQLETARNRTYEIYMEESNIDNESLYPFQRQNIEDIRKHWDIYEHSNQKNDMTNCRPISDTMLKNIIVQFCIFLLNDILEESHFHMY